MVRSIEPSLSSGPRSRLQSSANEPPCEREPGVGLAKSDAPWKRQREEQSTPQRNGVDPPPRPIVVRHDRDDEENGDTEERLRPDCIQYPYAAERGRKQRDRGEQHEPLVGLGAAAVVEPEPDENREYDDACQRNHQHE